MTKTCGRMDPHAGREPDVPTSETALHLPSELTLPLEACDGNGEKTGLAVGQVDRATHSGHTRTRDGPLNTLGIAELLGPPAESNAGFVGRSLTRPLGINPTDSRHPDGIRWVPMIGCWSGCPAGWAHCG
jgi:hypothetical protein